MAVAPGLVGRLWWGDELSGPAKAVLRGFGARDAVIGAGTALADDAQAGGWLRAGVVADLADLAAAALGGGSLPADKRRITMGFAAFGALGGLALAAGRR